MRAVDSKDDLNWLYVAYKKGALEGSEEGLDRETFMSEIADWVDAHDAVYFILAKLDRGETPVAVVHASLSGRIMEPHATWFPWACPRSRFEGAAAFFSHMGSRWKVIVTTQDAGLFQRLTKYGILNEVGVIHQYYENGDAAVFESSQSIE